MWNRFLSAAASLGLLLSAGCAMGPTMTDAGITAGRIELGNTAFFPDERRQAGPAALATLLYTDGAGTVPDTVMPLLRSDVGDRTPQSDLLSATLALDRVPTVLTPGYASLVAELQAGRPVLVLLVTAATQPEWRYAVVIGIEPETDSLILRNGRAGRQFMSFASFDRAWAPAHQWAMVTTRADELPATTTADRWIGVAERATKAQKALLAQAMISTAMKQWGESSGSWVAMGNARFAARDLNGASVAYRKAIELKPDNAVAHNNYAEVLLDRHCIDDAQDQIDQALKLETDPAVRQRYEGTQVMIHKHAGPSVYCPELAEGDVPPARFEGAPVDLNTLPTRPAPRLRKPKKTP